MITVRERSTVPLQLFQAFLRLKKENNELFQMKMYLSMYLKYDLPVHLQVRECRYKYVIQRFDFDERS